MLLASTAWSCLMLSALIATSVHDLLYRRIPNNLVLITLASGILYWALRFGIPGVIFAATGVATGLFLLLGFYILGWLGAGDVKIFGAFGATLGSHNIITAALFGLMAGGILSLLYMDKQGPRWDLLPAGRALERARQTGQTVPLGAALALGVLLVQLGWSL